MKMTLDLLLAAETKALVALAFRNGPIEALHAGKRCAACPGREDTSRFALRVGLLSSIQDHIQANLHTLADFIRNRTTPSSMNGVPAASRQLFWIFVEREVQKFLLLS